MTIADVVAQHNQLGDRRDALDLVRLVEGDHRASLPLGASVRPGRAELEIAAMDQLVSAGDGAAVAARSSQS